MYDEHPPSRDTAGKKSGGKSRIPIYLYDILGDLEDDSTGI
ncbi:MAG: hypothetical protein HMLIMOIP_001599 [Candidatus Nitrosomirales archaeon]|jgi:hypothetical protein